MVENQTQTAQQPSQAAESIPAIDLKGVSKSFGPVQANKDINLTVKRNSIHGIVGENEEHRGEDLVMRAGKGGVFQQWFYGWSDSENTPLWEESIHSLVFPNGSDISNVRFRFALAANNDEKSVEGFGFDNMVIFELEKT